MSKRVGRTAAKNKRIIRIIGEINYEVLSNFSNELAALESESHQDITVELCSEGGDTYAGLGFYSKIVNSPCDITVKAFGCVMSAATVILSAGDRRMMHKDCWMMVHDDSQHVDAPNGRIAVSEAKHLDELENHWAEILSRCCEVNPELWREMSLKTTYLRPAILKGLGFIHEVY